MNTPRTALDELGRIADRMDAESSDDMPMQFAGMPSVYADIRKWAADIRDHGRALSEALGTKEKKVVDFREVCALLIAGGYTTQEKVERANAILFSTSANEAGGREVKTEMDGMGKALGDVMALADRASPGEWESVEIVPGYHDVGCVGERGVSVSFDAERNTAAIAAAINFLRNHGPTLAALVADGGWLPIESAPKDVDVIVYMPGAAVPTRIAMQCPRNDPNEGWVWLDTAATNSRPCFRQPTGARSHRPRTLLAREVVVSDEYPVGTWDDIFSVRTLHSCYRTLPDGGMQLGGYEVIIRPDGTRIETEPHWNLTMHGVPTAMGVNFCKEMKAEERK